MSLRLRFLNSFFATLTAALCANVAHAQLLVGDGVVVKFDQDAELVLRSGVEMLGKADFTSIKDGTIGGITVAGVPQIGDWKGLRLERDVQWRPTVTSIGDVLYPFDRSQISYAAHGVTVKSNDVPLRFATFSNNGVAIRVIDGYQPRFSELLIFDNQVGIQSNAGEPNLTLSEIVGNTQFGAENQTPNATPLKRLFARQTWWGNASGPMDPVDNPNGSGDKVSSGVDYSGYLNKLPLTNCAVIPNLPLPWVTSAASIELFLRCRNASDVRLSEQANFEGATFAPMSNTRLFTLSPSFNPKRIYAQFRGAAGQLRTESVLITRQLQRGMSISTEIENNQVIVTDRLVRLNGSASGPAPIASLAFQLGRQVVATDNNAPFSVTIDTSSLPNGSYEVRATAVDAEGYSGSGPSFPPILTIARPYNDDVAPVISDFKFNGQALEHGGQVSSVGTFSVAIAETNSGLSRCSASIGGREQVVSTGAASCSFTTAWIDFSNGPYALRWSAQDRAGNTSETTIIFNLAISSLPPPIISAAPTAGRNGSLIVSGSSVAGSRIQIYLDDAPLQGLIGPIPDSTFSTSINLPPGAHTVSADASNVSGTSARSNVLNASYTPPTPAIVILSPYKDQIVDANGVFMRVGVVSILPGAQLKFMVDDTLVGTVVQPPYQLRYLPGNTPDGNKLLRVQAVVEGSVVAEATSPFVVRRIPVPEVYVPPYIATQMTVQSERSYGNQPVVITGAIRNNIGGTQLLGNTSANLVLRRDTFKRSIQIVTDPDGRFSYTFIPKFNDKGSYQVTAAHPQNREPFLNPTPTGVATMTIDRLTPSRSRVSARLPRGFPETVSIGVQASPGLGTKSAFLLLRAEDQPSGTIPAGLSIEMSPAQAIAPEGIGNYTLRVNSTAATPERGSVFVGVFASESGTTLRSMFRIDYQLYPAAPLLAPSKPSLATGVKRNQVINETIRISNTGLLTAQNVSFAWVAAAGSSLPRWVTISSALTVPELAAGEHSDVQLRVAPNQNVADGIYNGLLRVSAGNAPAGDVAVTIYVTDSGEGQVRFKVEDMFTNTVGENGLIQGVANAKVKLTSEVNVGNSVIGTTDAQGSVLMPSVAAGAYQYRISGPKHADVTGRVRVRNGAITEETVFIDYETIRFTWSVTPTTIPDRYEVYIQSTFQTLVPAPVITMTPSAINIPEMVIGEVISGEIKVKNEGLLRADNVSLILPDSDAIFEYTFLGTLPTELAAGQEEVIPYTIKKLSEPPITRSTALQSWIKDEPNRQTTGSCLPSFKWLRVEYDFTCANGTGRRSETRTLLALVAGVCDSPSVPQPPGVPTGWSWGGSGAGPAGGGAGAGVTFALPECTPDCAQTCTCASGCGPGNGSGGDGSFGPEDCPVD
jgi:large repetitive protein